MNLTRRRFVAQVAAAGSVSLAYEAMTGLGLLAAPSQSSFDLTGRVSGVRVVILGAGLAGMTVAYATYDTAGRIGLQFKRRFWEQDDEIYGGKSWTDQEIGQLLYPSHGFGGNKGIAVGYYLDFARAMVKRPPAEIQRMALEQGARIHPQYSSEFESAFSVTWARVPWNRGSWRSESSAALQALAALQQPDGRVHFAGDYMTNLSSFMQGAFESARAVATAIHARALTRA